MTEAIFVDTSAFLALLDADADENGAAVAAFSELRSSRGALVTHEYVVVETVALVQRRLGLEALRRFVDDLLPIAEIAWVDRELHREAVGALLAAGRRAVSLVDWVSFLVMRRRGIETAFAFDDDFAHQGFRTIPEG